MKADELINQKLKESSEKTYLLSSGRVVLRGNEVIASESPAVKVGDKIPRDMPKRCGWRLVKTPSQVFANGSKTGDRFIN